ncbi:unnamed protein product [Acanthosepion pharaonis]|uniref:Uncharacterized protein n=1 Tax=Acanthosepion pharaonis TaxID=158019 RepID=A0A812CP41_ACAPH|nr:unnamed protein product [Sepia pharaonis]
MLPSITFIQHGQHQSPIFCFPVLSLSFLFPPPHHFFVPPSSFPVPALPILHHNPLSHHSLSHSCFPLPIILSHSCSLSPHSLSFFSLKFSFLFFLSPSSFSLIPVPALPIILSHSCSRSPHHSLSFLFPSFFPHHSCSCSALPIFMSHSLSCSNLPSFSLIQILPSFSLIPIILSHSFHSLFLSPSLPIILSHSCSCSPHHSLSHHSLPHFPIILSFLFPSPPSFSLIPVPRSHHSLPVPALPSFSLIPVPHHSPHILFSHPSFLFPLFSPSFPFLSLFFHSCSSLPSFSFIPHSFHSIPASPSFSKIFLLLICFIPVLFHSHFFFLLVVK